MILGTTPKAENKGPREIPPAGMHMALLYRIVDAGWCVSEYQGEKKLRTEGRLDFELHPLDKKGNYIYMADGRPFSVAPGFMGWLTFTKMSEFLESWMGTPTVTPEQILGQPAMLTIVHKPYRDKMGKDQVAANVTGINPIPNIPGLSVPEMVNPPLVYSIREGNNLEDFLKIPAWIRKHIIEKSEDFKKLPDHVKIAMDGDNTSADTNPIPSPQDDLPF